MKDILLATILVLFISAEALETKSHREIIDTDKSDNSDVKGAASFVWIRDSGAENVSGARKAAKARERLRRNSPGATATPESDEQLTDWTDWSPCSTTVCASSGKQERRRKCLKEDGICPESSVEVRQCGQLCVEGSGIEYGEQEASWGSWQSWSRCSSGCGRGIQSRKRKCSDRSCSGHYREERSCFTELSCLPWSSWSVCSIPCGTGGSRSRSRLCFNQHYNTGVDSEHNSSLADTTQEQDIIDSSSLFCQNDDAITGTAPCSVAPTCGKRAWSEWGEWSWCSATCGAAVQTRTRSCVGHPSLPPCGGQSLEHRDCDLACWASWGQWTSCTRSCGRMAGVRHRFRECTSSSGRFTPFYECPGESKEKGTCAGTEDTCFMWNPWTEYSECTRTCGSGTKIRTRSCARGICKGKNIDTRSCNFMSCPFWTSWSRFGCCSKSCGEGGVKERSRRCRCSIDGTCCDGPNRERIECFVRDCNDTSSVFDAFRCGVNKAAAVTSHSVSPQRSAILRIFGGRDSLIRRWPWQGSWQNRGCRFCRWEHKCGATLIAAQWAVTAGHCIRETFHFINERDVGNYWSLVFGMQKLSEGGKRYFVRRAFVHDDYDFKNVTIADIALLKLDKPVSLTSDIRPICLPQTVQPPPGKKCFITGWGHLGPPPEGDEDIPNEKKADALQEGSIPIVNFTRCKGLGEKYKRELKIGSHMCAGDPDTTQVVDSCPGDSGGPLSCRRPSGQWYLAGVTSFGFEECGLRHHVGVYAPVVPFERWIRDTVENNAYEDC